MAAFRLCEDDRVLLMQVFFACVCLDHFQTTEGDFRQYHIFPILRLDPDAKHGQRLLGCRR